MSAPLFQSATASVQLVTVPTMQPLLLNGPPEKRINLVFLSEGYSESQLSQFTADSQALLSFMLNAEVLEDYATYFNAFTIAVASKESGSDHPSANVFRDTYFNSTYDSYCLPHGLTIPPNDRDSDPDRGFGKVNTLIANYIAGSALPLVVVNDPVYGGWGDKRGVVVSVNSAAGQVVFHEFGHALAGLGDEYNDPFPCDPDPVKEEPNTTQETRREFIKWRAWIPSSAPIPTPASTDYADVVGLFEGARYNSTGWYRPKLSCRMRDLNYPFCEVCQEAIVLSIYNRVRPIESASPEPGTLPATKGQLLRFSAITMKPLKHSLRVRWSVDGIVSQETTVESFALNTQTLTEGIHNVTVEVFDPTFLVQSDPQHQLLDQRSWTVAVKAASPRTRRRP